MNIFRLVGDISHQLSFVCLMLQLYRSKNARGISLKTQELRLMVFCCRYLDLFTTFYSLYNTIVKIFYITATHGIISTIRCTEPIKSHYNYEQDSFPHWKYCAAPCFLIAMVVHLVGSGVADWNIMEYFWTVSILLKSITILPQLVVLRQYRLVEKWTGRFLLLLGTYRIWYIMNWVYRFHYEKNYRHHSLVYFCGVVEILVFGDYFYQYCRLSRWWWCGCRRGRGNNHNNDKGGDDRDDDNDDDDNALVFEMSRDNTPSNDTDAVEPLLVQNGELRRRMAEDDPPVSIEASPSVPSAWRRATRIRLTRALFVDVVQSKVEDDPPISMEA